MPHQKLAAAFLAALLVPLAPDLGAQPDLLGLVRREVWPAAELPDYERAKSPLVEWNTSTFNYYPPGQTRTYGFLDSLATERILPVILPLSIGTVPRPWFGRPDDPRMPALPQSGLYIAVDINVGMIYLPRRDRRPDGSAPDLHDHGFVLGSGVTNPRGSDADLMTPIPACFSRIDHRRIRLVTPDGKVYHPDGELWYLRETHGLNGPGDLYDPTKNASVFYARPPVPTCSMRNIIDDRAHIGFLMRFDTGSKVPLNFQLEMAPLEVRGKEIPLPPVTFAPFDVLKNKWIDK